MIDDGNAFPYSVMGDNQHIKYRWLEFMNAMGCEQTVEVSSSCASLWICMKVVLKSSSLKEH